VGDQTGPRCSSPMETIAKYMNVFCLTDSGPQGQAPEAFLFYCRNGPERVSGQQAPWKTGHPANDHGRGLFFERPNPRLQTWWASSGYGFRPPDGFLQSHPAPHLPMAVALRGGPGKKRATTSRKRDSSGCLCVVPRTAIQDRRDGDHDPGRPKPLLRSGVAHGPRARWIMRSRPGQMVFRADCGEVPDRGPADARRLRYIDEYKCRGFTATPRSWRSTGHQGDRENHRSEKYSSDLASLNSSRSRQKAVGPVPLSAYSLLHTA